MFFDANERAVFIAKRGSQTVDILRSCPLLLADFQEGLGEGQAGGANSLRNFTVCSLTLALGKK